MSFLHRTSLFLALGIATLIVAPSAFAATPGQLIKGSTSTVYYFSTDGKRYVFPNASTYHSWYDADASIETLSSDQLAAIPLGGNMTFRPGSTLVKITTDPKVYAVSRHGVLHWVQNETLATSLYGTDWNTKIIDVPYAFFVNYTVGSPIVSEHDFNPDAELANASTPDDNLAAIGSGHASASAAPITSATSSTTLPAFDAPIHPNLVLSVTPRETTVGSRISFTSDASYVGHLTSHQILALIPGNDKPVVWKDCGSLALCAASSPAYRSMTLISRIVINDTVYRSAPAAISITGGTAPHATLSVTGYPSRNTVNIHMEAPHGDTINTTALVDGTMLDGKTLALCDASCDITVQVNTAGSITAFTYVGGRYEASNVVTVKPE